MGSPDAAKRNPGYFSPLSVLSRISLRFIRATPFPKTLFNAPLIMAKLTNWCSLTNIDIYQ
ncbi:hypothetical protein UP09_22780 [Bradyrhizobium sp. LTSP885]|nr:hypothetical protein UP09_22780 [Bradyrhizobium sp. LTSP885]